MGSHPVNCKRGDRAFCQLRLLTRLIGALILGVYELLRAQGRLPLKQSDYNQGSSAPIQPTGVRRCTTPKETTALVAILAEARAETKSRNQQIMDALDMEDEAFLVAMLEGTIRLSMLASPRRAQVL